MKINPLLCCDFYKVTHMNQYPIGLKKLVSYFTPRMSRIKGQDELISFGFQSFIKEYLIEAFDEYFFKREKSEVLGEYTRVLTATIGKKAFDVKNIESLYDLGYLPLEIKVVPEGMRVPMKVPMLEISNTHDDFAWLVNSVETLLSCTVWHTMTSANVGYSYRQIVNKYYDISVDEDVPKRRAIGDFSMRGQESLESAIKSSAAFCLSFVNTATVPAVLYLEKYYNCDSTKEEVAFGSISTEHSVMTSNFAVDGDEITFVKRLLTKIYPDQTFSMVSDSYDYWHLVDVILPQCKEEIENHQGLLLIRGDSGDPVEIVTQTVFHLWKTFGGTYNKKGFKVLNPKIKAIYGDSITPQRLEKIYQILIENGFACSNVALGSGSFSMQCLEIEDKLSPYTRDTYGIAVKSTFGIVGDKEFAIFKDPKTDTGSFKKSQKGLCCVYFDENGEMTYRDEIMESTITEKDKDDNILETIFKDGKMIKEYTLEEIRNRLHNNNF